MVIMWRSSSCRDMVGIDNSDVVLLLGGARLRVVCKIRCLHSASDDISETGRIPRT